MTRAYNSVRRHHVQWRVEHRLGSPVIILLSLLPHASGPSLVCFFVSSVHQRAVRSSCFEKRAVLWGHGAAVPCANINGKGSSGTQLEPHWARDRGKGCVGYCSMMLCLKISFPHPLERNEIYHRDEMCRSPFKTFTKKTNLILVLHAGLRS